MDLPIKTSDFPSFFVCLPEGSWMVYTGKSPSEMDWWYPFLSLESPIEN
jgi:hypothetical protein